MNAFYDIALLLGAVETDPATLVVIIFVGLLFVGAVLSSAERPEKKHCPFCGAKTSYAPRADGSPPHCSQCKQILP